MSAAPVISAINAQNLFTAPQAEWIPQMAAMQANGIQVVRSPADWQTIEPLAPGPAGPTYLFAQFDAWVAALAVNHLRWQPILFYRTSWGNPITNYPAFEGYAQAVASRYGAGGSFWAANPELPYLPVQVYELWNEEDGPQWYIKPSDFAALYGAIHTALHVLDANATVIIGGLGTRPHFDPSHDDPGGYVVQMLDTHPELKGHIDGIGMHPYGASVTDNLEWIAHFRNALRVFGLGSVPLYLTEFGWTYSPDQESWRADQMRTMAQVASSDCGIAEVAPYDWVNPAPNGGTDFGFVDTTGVDTTLRPAASSWFSTLGQAGPSPEANLCNTTTPSPGAGTNPTATAKPKPKPPKKKKKKKKKHHGSQHRRRHH